ncbi:MAG: prepilin-type N-terminal cleavage/methylation domain-containing protein [Spartobacteria bacterium]|nr:prepilin-type N-terminal cleavage/methylation domain-containing protein [Spartobacteria bacterium]
MFNTTYISDKNSRHHQGFTLVEMMFASAIGLMAIGTVWTVFLSTIKTASKAQQYAWAQSETLTASQRLASYIRNASSIESIDTSGNWVQIRMPDGTVSRFEYVNITGEHGEGKMLFEKDISAGTQETLVAEGLTKVMTHPARNVFSQSGANGLRIAFRITKPLSPGECPAEIDIGVRLRNN